jgi:mRNA interferase MazF
LVEQNGTGQPGWGCRVELLHRRNGMQRGEIWWADFPPPLHRRPVVVVSRDATDGGGTVVVARITARIRDTPAEVPLGAEDGLPKTVINARWLSTLPRDGLVSRIASLSAQKLAQLDEALRYALNLPAATNGDRPQLPVKQPRLHFGGGSFPGERSR